MSSGRPNSDRTTWKVLSGLLMAGFVVSLSSTIVANALPRTMASLEGNQRQYSWVATAALLTMAASGPIWGKLADRMNNRSLIQLSFVIFILASVASGFSPNAWCLIVTRAFVGIGMGGLSPLVQIVVSSIFDIWDRVRYIGYFSSVCTVGAMAGPLAGGLIVDTPFLGWRWCYWVTVPPAIVALFAIHKTLRLPVKRSNAKVDWLGATLIFLSLSVVLIWITLGGRTYDWMSWPSIVHLAAGVTLTGLAIAVERRVTDPTIPHEPIRRPTIWLACVASAAVGVAVVGSALYLAQYFQIARGLTPTKAGALSLFVVVAIVLANNICGVVVKVTGRLKDPLVVGYVLIVVGLGSLGTIDDETSLIFVLVATTILGLGIGAALPSLTITVQACLGDGEVGAGTAIVLLFRSVGGAAGAPALGAVFSSYLSVLVARRLGSLGYDSGVERIDLESLDVGRVPWPQRGVLMQAYGDAAALVFTISASVAVVGLVAVLLIRDVPSRQLPLR